MSDFNMAIALKELATLIEAGFSIAEAWQTSSFGHTLSSSSKLVTKQLTRGNKLSTALHRYPLFSSSQIAFIAAAETSGQLIPCLKTLAQQTEQQLRFKRKLLSDSWLQLGIIILVWIAGSLLSIMSPDQTLSIFWLSSLPLTVMYIGFLWILVKLAQQDAWWWNDILWRIRLRNVSWAQSVFHITWVKLLGWQLAAGVDLASALASLSPLINSKDYRKKIRQAQRLANEGHTLQHILIHSQILMKSGTKAFITTGEASGNLPLVLHQISEAASIQLAIQLKDILFWLPYVLYFITLAVSVHIIRAI